MVKLTVLYPQNTNSHFDMRYYLDKHIPMVKERLAPLGLVRVEVEEGMAGVTPDSPTTYSMIGRLNFNSLEELHIALEVYGEEFIRDMSNFTDVQPQMQISQELISTPC
ncbi:EthD family reductase [Nibrella viscosa]